MRLEEHFESSSTLQRNERVKLAASFWNNVGAGMVIGGMAAAFFLDKPSGVWTKIGIAIAGLVLGWHLAMRVCITARPIRNACSG
jgi:F0F1-type ATP synthase assembly protein I